MDISRVKWLGLTGGIATGKSTACKYLIEQSIPVIDADKISHSLLLADGLAVAPIVDKFGDKFLNPDKSVSRPKLGELVFSNKGQLLELNKIMHPLVRQKTNKIKAELISRGHNLIINDVPLLFENSLQNQYDKTILIYCDEPTQRLRLKLRNTYSETEIENRLKSQMSIEDKTKLSDIIVNNNADLESLYSQLDKLVTNLKSI